MAERNLGGYGIPTAVGGARRARVDVASLRTFVTSLLTAARFPRPRAELVADSLVYADMRGIGSHGVSRARIYTRRAVEGMVDPDADPVVVRGKGATRLLDGRNAPGQVAADVAVTTAVEGAHDLGACAVGVVNSNHCGTLAYFLSRITDAGLVGLAGSNGPPVMAYHGGRTRAVGTNPLGYAFPRPDGPPVVLDMATSNAARGKIIQMARTGEGQVPEGWAVDAEGRPTTDPVEAIAGAVLPFAGPKGSGLAMGIELLCGTLLSGVTGSAVGDMYENWDRTQQVGHFFLALDPDCFAGRQAFDENIRRFVTEVKQLPPAVGHSEVLLPGEREHWAAQETEAHGVPLPGAVVDDLRELGRELAVQDVLLERPGE